jgi:hypothetical protein
MPFYLVEVTRQGVRLRSFCLVTRQGVRLMPIYLVTRVNVLAL